MIVAHKYGMNMKKCKVVAEEQGAHEPKLKRKCQAKVIQ